MRSRKMASVPNFCRVQYFFQHMCQISTRKYHLIIVTLVLVNRSENNHFSPQGPWILHLHSSAFIWLTHKYFSSKVENTIVLLDQISCRFLMRSSLVFTYLLFLRFSVSLEMKVCPLPLFCTQVERTHQGRRT